jgi:hypothetical protein
MKGLLMIFERLGFLQSTYTDVLYNNSDVGCHSCFDWTKTKLKVNLRINKSKYMHTHLKSVTTLTYHSLDVL